MASCISRTSLTALRRSERERRALCHRLYRGNILVALIAQLGHRIARRLQLFEQVLRDNDELVILDDRGLICQLWFDGACERQPRIPPPVSKESLVSEVRSRTRKEKLADAPAFT